MQSHERPDRGLIRGPFAAGFNSDFRTAKFKRISHRRAHVYRIWREFFHFAENAADLLTRLTTKDARVFQGTPTSSYLANLAFWDREPALVLRLISRGIRYSRYVDDIAVSSPAEMSEEDKRWAISQVYGMIGAAGFKPKRSKHKGLSARGSITMMGLNANASFRPTITKQERANTRALIFQLGGLSPNPRNFSNPLNCCY